MGNLILCHDKHATHPYEITRIHCRIFTIEELCFYLCNNLYLIDYTIMNEQLCTWIEEEIGMKELADSLRDVLRLRGSVEKFVLTILKASRIYREPQMIHIQNVLEHLKNQRDIERQKYKGDNLLESGEIEEAILVYQSILNQEARRCLRTPFPLSGIGPHVRQSLSDLRGQGASEAVSVRILQVHVAGRISYSDHKA